MDPLLLLSLALHFFTLGLLFPFISEVRDKLGLNDITDESE